MRELLKTVTKSEWRFVGLMSLVMVVVTGGPYLYAALTTPPGYVYNGLNSLTPGDNPVYYSYINQIRNGAWVLRDLFTTEAQPQGVFNIFWLPVGLLARLFDWSAPVAFHVARLLLIPVFVATVYIFIALFFKTKKERQWCLVLLLLSAGLGAYIIGPLSLFDFSDKPGFWTPHDIWVPESIVFLTLYKTPHFIASLTLMILALLLMFLAFEHRRFSYSLWAGLVGLVHFNFHPFYVPLIFGVVAVYLLVLCFERRRIDWPLVGYFISFVAVASPSIFYHLYLLTVSPVLAQRGWQNVTLAPPLIFIIIGYGFLWLGFSWGLYQLLREKKMNRQFTFLLVWVVVALALIISPNQFQSRYLQGLQLPLVIFTNVAIFNWLRTKNRQVGFAAHSGVTVLFAFIFIFGFSNLFNLTRDLYYFTEQPGATIRYFYFSADQLAVAQYLRTQPTNQVVLADDIDFSLFIPALTNQRVFIGHGIETNYFEQKKLYWAWFFSHDRQSEKKQAFLARESIDYVIVIAPASIAGFEPETKDYLDLAFDRPSVQVYRVR